jgi:hypothetical protein
VEVVGVLHWDGDSRGSGGVISESHDSETVPVDTVVGVIVLRLLLDNNIHFAPCSSRCCLPLFCLPLLKLPVSGRLRLGEEQETSPLIETGVGGRCKEEEEEVPLCGDMMDEMCFAILFFSLCLLWKNLTTHFSGKFWQNRTQNHSTIITKGTDNKQWHVQYKASNVLRAFLQQ